MERPFENEAILRTRDRVIYHTAQLQADEHPDILALAPSAQARLDQIDAHLAQRQRLDDDITRALAARDRRDLQADKLLRRFDLALLSLTERRRDDARFFAVYQGANLSTVIRLPIPEQVHAMQNMVASLDRPDLAPLKADWQAPLADATAKLDAAQTALADALRARANATAQASLLRLDVVRLLELNHAELSALFPHDRDVVESYFTSLARRPTPADE